MKWHFDPKRIMEVRDAAGMKQKELADAVHVGKDHMNSVEKGRSPCSLDLAERIAAACNVEMWTLYAAVPRDGMVTPQEREVLRRLRALSGEDQARVLGYIDALGVSDEAATPAEPLLGAEAEAAIRRGDAARARKRAKRA